MGSKSSYMNNFTISMQNLTCILEAKSTAPNIEKTGYGVPPVFDERKVVDESYLFMPVEVAKELAISILHVVGSSEKRSGIKIRLSPDKQAKWDAAIQAIDAYEAEKARQNENSEEN